jgi:hypothetical protein
VAGKTSAKHGTLVQTKYWEHRCGFITDEEQSKEENIKTGTCLDNTPAVLKE